MYILQEQETVCYVIYNSLAAKNKETPKFGGVETPLKNATMVYSWSTLRTTIQTE